MVAKVIEGALTTEPTIYNCHCGKKATTRIDSFRDLECLSAWFGPQRPSHIDHHMWVCCDEHTMEAIKLNNERTAANAIALVRSF